MRLYLVILQIESFLPDIVGCHRWLRTGDEVKLNEKREIFVVDRIKELIKVRGFQVAPSELEGHLLDHPAVADVCVVGIPDHYSGELPFAFVVLDQDVQARVKENYQEKKNVEQGVMKVCALPLHACSASAHNR